MNTNLQTATLAGGCFWCLEAVYDEIKGVHGVESGYAGGHMANPTYRAVCNGDTGHAEVVQVHRVARFGTIDRDAHDVIPELVVVNRHRPGG